MSESTILKELTSNVRLTSCAFSPPIPRLTIINIIHKKEAFIFIIIKSTFELSCIIKPFSKPKVLSHNEQYLISDIFCEIIFLFYFSVNTCIDYFYFFFFFFFFHFFLFFSCFFFFIFFHYFF